MKTKIYILGDSHTCYYNYENSIEDDINIKKTYMGINFEFMSRISMSMYRMDYSLYAPLEYFEKDAIIMPAVGEFDVRFNLNRHNNADELAKKYVLKTINYFPNHKIRFIEPMLQASDDITIKHFIDNPPPPDLPPIIHSYAPLEKRVEQQKLLIKYLRKYSEEYGLLKPINLIDNVIKTNILDARHANGIHVNSEYGKKIIFEIVKENFWINFDDFN